MRSFSHIVLSLFTAVILLAGCDEEKEEITIAPATEYIPLQVGKYMIYRLDSFVFVQQGTREETHYFQEKHVVDAQVTDNLGRSSFRIFRFLRDTAATQPWVSAGTYYVTPMNTSVEVIENNMRVLKLVAPLSESKTWKGNRYLNTDPFAPTYLFSNDDDINDWDFSVDEMNGTETILGKTYTDVITISSLDETVNVPITDPRLYASRTYYQEKYAKGIGLVAQDIIMWEYQPGSTTGTKTGFGVKRRLLEHN